MQLLSSRSTSSKRNLPVPSSGKECLVHELADFHQQIVVPIVPMKLEAPKRASHDRNMLESLQARVTGSIGERAHGAGWRSD